MLVCPHVFASVAVQYCGSPGAQQKLVNGGNKVHLQYVTTDPTIGESRHIQLDGIIDYSLNLRYEDLAGLLCCVPRAGSYALLRSHSDLARLVCHSALHTTLTLILCVQLMPFCSLPITGQTSDTFLTPAQASQFVAALDNIGITFLDCTIDPDAPCSAQISAQIVPITTGDPW